MRLSVGTLYHKWNLQEVGTSVSIHQPALDEDLALPQRHWVTVLCLLLVAHVTLNLGFEVEPESEDTRYLKTCVKSKKKLPESAFLGKKVFDMT